MTYSKNEDGDAQSQAHDDDVEPATERTALLHDSQRRHTDPPTHAPIRIPRGGNESDDYDSEDDLDPNESDLLIARSFTSGASGLAPESLESAMLRGRRSRSAMRRSSMVHSIVSVSPRPIVTNSSHRHQPQPQQPGPELSFPSADDLEAGSNSSTPVDDGGSGANAKEVPSFLIDTDRRRFWIVFLSIMMTHFIACFDGTIMAVCTRTYCVSILNL